MYQEEHRDAPEQHEFESPRRQPVVLRATPAALGALRSIPRMRVDSTLEDQPAGPLVEWQRAVDKSSVLLNSIQDSLDLHPAVRLREGGEFGHRHCLSVGAGCGVDRGARPRLWTLIRIGGHLAMSPLSHHRAYGSVPRRFGRLSRHAFSR